MKQRKAAAVLKKQNKKGVTVTLQELHRGGVLAVWCEVAWLVVIRFSLYSGQLRARSRESNGKFSVLMATTHTLLP